MTNKYCFYEVFLLIILGLVINASSCLAELYPAKENDLWGYINEKGEKTLDFKWNYAGKFRGEGFAIVSDQSGQNGIIDQSGNIIIPCKYDIFEGEEGILYGDLFWLYEAETDSFGFFNVRNGYFSGMRFGDCIRHQGESINLMVSDKNNLVGFINKYNGIELTPFIFDMNKCTTFMNGFAYVTKQCDNTAILINEQNHVINLPDNFEYATGIRIQNNRIPIYSIENYKYGFSDTEGKIIIQPSYDEIYGFSDGICAVYKNGQTYGIDTQGRVLFMLEQDGWNPFLFYQGKAILINGDIIDTTGKTIFENNQNMSILDVLSSGSIVYEDEDNYIGLINSDGKVLWDSSNQCTWNPQDDSIWEHNATLFPNDMQVLINDEEKYGYIDTTGRLLIDFIFDYADQFEQKLAYVEIGGKMEYINQNGEVIWKEE